MTQSIEYLVKLNIKIRIKVGKKFSNNSNEIMTRLNSIRNLKKERGLIVSPYYFQMNTFIVTKSKIFKHILYNFQMSTFIKTKS